MEEGRNWTTAPLPSSDKTPHPQEIKGLKYHANTPAAHPSAGKSIICLYRNALSIRTVTPTQNRVIDWQNLVCCYDALVVVVTGASQRCPPLGRFCRLASLCISLRQKWDAIHRGLGWCSLRSWQLNSTQASPSTRLWDLRLRSLHSA